MAEKVIMLGNEAIARGAYEAGVKVSSAYPELRVLRSVNILSSTGMMYMKNGHRTKRWLQR